MKPSEVSRALADKPLSPILKTAAASGSTSAVKSFQFNYSGHFSRVQLHESTWNGTPCKHDETPPSVPVTDTPSPLPTVGSE
jgi:hypothetical protein